jgi:hypothetical protein
MKKLVTLVIIVFCSFSFGFGQTNIYGGGFEHWKQTLGHRYFEPDSSMFWTLNQLDTVAALTPLITVYPCDTAYSGNYSARLVTQNIQFMGVVVPGVIGNLKIDWASERAILGSPYPYGDSLPQRFSGYYQSYPEGSDSSAAVILLSKWNAASHQRDTLGYNYMPFHGTVNTWTHFEMPVIYRDPNTQPDSLTILLLSCGGFNARNMFGSHGQIGSKALFDDVTVTGFLGVGLPRLSKPSFTVSLSPNPTSGLLTIELENEVKDGDFEVYNGHAQLMNRYPINGKVRQIDVSNFPAGLYYYKLTSNSKSLSSGTFIVTK